MYYGPAFSLGWQSHVRRATIAIDIFLSVGPDLGRWVWCAGEAWEHSRLRGLTCPAHLLVAVRPEFLVRGGTIVGVYGGVYGTGGKAYEGPPRYLRRHTTARSVRCGVRNLHGHAFSDLWKCLSTTTVILRPWYPWPHYCCTTAVLLSCHLMLPLLNNINRHSQILCHRSFAPQNACFICLTRNDVPGHYSWPLLLYY